MTNVWKIGSRWGDGGPSVLDLFLDYGCVFFGSKNDGRVGDWGSVRQGDLFIVSDKSVPVAIGTATGRFTAYNECGIRFRKSDVDEFVDDEVAVCPARLVLLSEKERGQYWGMDTRKRFCRAAGAAEQVRTWWDEHEKNEKRNPFEIKTRVVSLLDPNDKDRLIQESTKYHVPIYQRPYSWGEPELRRLVEDLHQACANGEDAFLGTIQLSQPIPLSPDGHFKSYDVIDGQQRLTTFILLLAILEKATGGESTTLEYAKKNLRTSVNRRTAQDDLEAAFAYFDTGFPRKGTPAAAPDNPYIENANIIDGLLHEYASRTADGDVSDCRGADSEEDFAQYAGGLLGFLATHVKFVVLETHAGLSKTLKIFNTINSSGLDLGSEDLFKVRFYEYSRTLGEGEEVFDRISALYERIDEYNRHPCIDAYLSMSQVLSTCQRYLIAKYDLNAGLFTMSSERFFEELFDTALGIRPISEFRCFADMSNAGRAAVLSLQDLEHILACHIQYLEACAKDPDSRIARSMLWETRYGYAADFPVLAMVLHVATPETVKEFAWGLLKALVPASIYYAKHVYHGRACLVEFLKSMWNHGFGGGDSVVEWARAKWRFNGLDAAGLIDAALDQTIAWTPKWKNLLCRLAEYVKSPEKDEALFRRLFQTGFDIEHIQSWTDEDAPEKTRADWGEEINKLGNLAMFERELNRRVHNHPDQKAAAYGDSVYATVRELQPKVREWSKGDAIARRTALAASIKQFLLAD